MLLMIIPYVLTDADAMYCLAVAPTLVLSLMFILLYLVDQVNNVAEELYLIIQIGINIMAIAMSMMKTTLTAPLYVVFYWHLLFALCIDQYCIIKERGFALFD